MTTPRDRYAQLLEALRAIADLSEPTPPGGIDFWLRELALPPGWEMEPAGELFLLREPDGRGDR